MALTRPDTGLPFCVHLKLLGASAACDRRKILREVIRAVSAPLTLRLARRMLRASLPVDNKVGSCTDWPKEQSCALIACHLVTILIIISEGVVSRYVHADFLRMTWRVCACPYLKR